MTSLVIASLIVPVLLIARAVWVWARRALRPATPTLGQPSAETWAQLARSSPSADMIIDGPPPLDAAPLLEGQRQLAPPAVDFALVGVTEDRDEANTAIWRLAQRALAQRGDAAGRSS
ncbi:MAG: hypothetical protein QM820_16790 [Minicystis sp.]